MEFIKSRKEIRNRKSDNQKAETHIPLLQFGIAGGGSGGLAFEQIKAAFRVQIGGLKVVLVGNSGGDGGPDLPDVVENRLALLRQDEGGEDGDGAGGGLSGGVLDVEPELGFGPEGGVGGDVVGLDGHVAVGLLEGEEGLGAGHAGGGGVEGPGDPAVGLGRGGDEGDGEGGLGLVEVPVEEGVEGGEVAAEGVALVVVEGLLGTRGGL